MEPLTSDSFFDGRLRIRQFCDGYRFSIDAVILAHHVRPHRGETLLELGAGCGVVSLIVAFRHPEVFTVGVEIQPELARLARENVTANNMQDRIRIMCADLKTFGLDDLEGPVDWVISNPPYRKADSGRLNPNLQKAVARHEIEATFQDVLEAARRSLSTGGRFLTVYTAERVSEAMHQMHSAGIEPKYCRMVHSSIKTNAKLVVLKGIKGSRPGVVIAPPLLVHNQSGGYTKEMDTIFQH